MGTTILGSAASMNARTSSSCIVYTSPTGTNSRSAPRISSRASSSGMHPRSPQWHILMPSISKRYMVFGPLDLPRKRSWYVGMPLTWRPFTTKSPCRASTSSWLPRMTRLALWS